MYRHPPNVAPICRRFTMLAAGLLMVMSMTPVPARAQQARSSPDDTVKTAVPTSTVAPAPHGTSRDTLNREIVRRQQARAAAADGPTGSTLLPYGATGYRYAIVAHGAQTPGYESPGYDDSGWSVGDAAFGTAGTCPLGPTIKTSWPPNTDIWVRKHLNIPLVAGWVTVSVAVDNDVAVWWNGTQVGSAVHDGCASLDSFTFAVPPGALRSGDNLLAVRGADRGLETYLDVTVRTGTGVPPGQTYGDGSLGDDGQGVWAEPVESGTGLYHTATLDLGLAGLGVPFRLVRSYTSADTTAGELGVGWTDPFEAAVGAEQGGG